MRKLSHAVFWILFVLLVSHVHGQQWQDLSDIITSEIANRSFPGATALVKSKTKTFFSGAFGNFTYGIPPPENQNNPQMKLETRFDLASLTKVLSTTTASMMLYQQGILNLQEAVCSPLLLGPSFAANNKSSILVEHLLLHVAGFPPDPSPNFWQQEFPCKNNRLPSPPEDFSCQKIIYAALMNQTIETIPGQHYVYSDLSMITMMYVLGRLIRDNNLVAFADLRQDCMQALTTNDPESYQCFYEAFVRVHVFKRLGLENTGFLPDEDIWSEIPPAWNDTNGSSPGPAYRNKVIQGQVSDGNSYVLGGIAGHAGLFSNVIDIGKIVGSILFADEQDPYINATTANVFTTVKNKTISSRALGWDTNDYTMNSYRGCGNLSQVTFTHTGYTGTEVCADKDRKIMTILLTNRVYPKANEESSMKVHAARQSFNNKVKEVCDNDPECFKHSKKFTNEHEV